uniref:hypothetical protein n=1 Tax=Microbacterium karelineae TaxID=2654283 RepID=UPI0018D42E21
AVEATVRSTVITARSALVPVEATRGAIAVEATLATAAAVGSAAVVETTRAAVIAVEATRATVAVETTFAAVIATR